MKQAAARSAQNFKPKLAEWLHFFQLKTDFQIYFWRSVFFIAKNLTPIQKKTNIPSRTLRIFEIGDAKRDSMSALVAYGRRFFVYTYTSLILTTGTPIRVGLAAWSTCWMANRSAIVMLTAVNTSITVGMEVVTRSVSAPLTSSADDYHFLVRDSSGVTTINRQSLINIWMTFFASLLGGPVYFFNRRWSRFLFFAGFGMFNSCLGGCITSLIRDGVLAILPKRVLFDLIYSGTFKFLSFEVMRSPILSRKSRPFRVGLLRVTQDFVNTFIRVVVLNVLGFKG